MKSYVMTAEETKGWESEDDATRDAARSEVRKRAAARAVETGETIEIYTDDSCVVDVSPALVSYLQRHQETVGRWLEQDAE